MKQILLSQGKFTIVDDEDFEKASEFKWYCLKDGNNFYAVRNAKPRGTIWLHRFLKNCPNGKYIDHVNRNGLDNRKSNLRICTKKQNLVNTFTHKNNKSGYKGVSWAKQRNRWLAHITKDGKGITLGYFKDKKEAAIAYNKAAIFHHGDFAVLNPL